MQQVSLGRQGFGFAPVSVVAVSFALLVSILWFFGNAEQVYACSCVQPGTPSEELEKISAVFAGRVVSVRHSYDPDGRSVTRDDRSTIGFEVSAVWKGTVYEDMSITTPPTGGSCGFTFEEGEEYIVYAYDSPYVEGGYTTGICSRTALLEQAQEDIDELGEGRAPLGRTTGAAPEEPKITDRDGARSLMLAIVAPILAVAGIVLYALFGCR
ncbi:MAG: hypothetical protein F4Y50_06880 [Dehalococcoidia bacterium]|nr:hypothetical protein [Dehalococcoidia bacterium]